MKADLSFVALREKQSRQGEVRRPAIAGPYKAESSNAGREEAVPGSDCRLLGAPLGAEAVEGAPGAMAGGGRGVQALPSLVPPPTAPWRARLRQPDCRAPAAAPLG